EVNLCECKDGDNCGESCINRELFIECNPMICNCRNRCTNQRFQRYRDFSKYLKVFWAGQKGYGLKTIKPIKKDKLIIEYTGEVISLKTCMERLNTIYKEMKSFYFINYDDGKVIDACQKGNVARFANHSCDPNCCIERWIVNNEIRVGLFALRDIKAGEELFYDYKFFSFGEKQKCYCGSKNCCGSIDFNESNHEKEKKKSTKNIKNRNHLNVN
ncbi:SET domain-containing protein, partial [Anaeromyces robustus]